MTSPPLPTPTSAIFGQPPANDHDALTIRYALAFYFDIDTPLNSITNLSAAHIFYTPPPASWHGGNRQGMVRAISIMLIVLCLVSTISRLVIRVYKAGWSVRGLRVDDFFAVCATVTIVILALMLVWFANKGGIGKHNWEQTWADLRFAFETGPASYTVFFLSSAFTKIVILFYIRHVVQSTMPRLRRLVELTIVSLLIYAILATFLFNFACGNPRYSNDILWAATQPVTLRCRSFYLMNQVFSGLHVGFDLAIFAIALYVNISLRASLARRLSLILLFALGAVSCAFSVWRLAGQTAGSELRDGNYSLGLLLVLGELDVATALLVANFPVIYGFMYDRMSNLNLNLTRAAPAPNTRDPLATKESQALTTVATASLSHLTTPSHAGHRNASTTTGLPDEEAYGIAVHAYVDEQGRQCYREDVISVPCPARTDRIVRGL